MATEVKTTVPGNMWKVLVKEGDVVKKGDPLFIMEVMKTEVHHDAPVDGKITLKLMLSMIKKVLIQAR